MIWRLSASILMALTAAVHVFAGGPEIMGPVYDASLSPDLRAVLHVVWHGITAFLACSALALLWLVRHPQERALAVFISAVQLLFAALFLGIGVIELGEVWTMPQWIAFLLIPAFTWLGMRAST